MVYVEGEERGLERGIKQGLEREARNGTIESILTLLGILPVYSPSPKTNS